ncbi:phosphotransferase [Neolewinella aurantiaca]|uniref:Phosphotransferase n=1 Tax=Neolewinella aurantiaca TaxID=2602767 RepID=A0A5C7FN57_9BACT|nr:phosphotransferase [Neolewinella aurantiaca]TXF87770.1 phosphotransferase [Neolewinella aurantiaca]
MNHLFEKHFNANVFADICERYGLRAETAKLIKEDSNLIYDCDDSILRVSYSDIRAVTDIEPELDWMDFLHRKEVPVARVTPSLADRNLERIDCDSGHFTAVLFRKITGRGIDNETWNEAHFRKLGRLTGLIHKTSQAYPHQNRLRYKHWDELVECSYVNLLPEDERRLRQLTKHLTDEFHSYDQSPEHYGFIHNDIHHENYLLVGPKNTIVLFDFEVACQSWYTYEIATALYYACLVKRNRNNTDFEQVFLTNFLEGYRSHHSLAPVPFDTVLKFMLYRDLFLYGYMTAMWQHRTLPQRVAEYIKLIEDSIAIRRKRLAL